MTAWIRMIPDMDTGVGPANIIEKPENLAHKPGPEADNMPFSVPKSAISCSTPVCQAFC